MREAVVVTGRISDPRHIELEEPLTDLRGRVEVVVRSVGDNTQQTRKDILDLILALPAGKRTKRDIDKQIDAERASWGDL